MPSTAFTALPPPHPLPHPPLQALNLRPWTILNGWGEWHCFTHPFTQLTTTWRVSQAEAWELLQTLALAFNNSPPLRRWGQAAYSTWPGFVGQGLWLGLGADLASPPCIWPNARTRLPSYVVPDCSRGRRYEPQYVYHVVDLGPGRRARLHRLLGVLRHGGGALVMHTCPGDKNKGCCSPWHLELGSNSANRGRRASFESRGVCCKSV